MRYDLSLERELLTAAAGEQDAAIEGYLVERVRILLDGVACEGRLAGTAPERRDQRALRPRRPGVRVRGLAVRRVHGALRRVHRCGRGGRRPHERHRLPARRRERDLRVRRGASRARRGRRRLPVVDGPVRGAGRGAHPRGHRPRAVPARAAAGRAQLPQRGRAGDRLHGRAQHHARPGRAGLGARVGRGRRAADRALDRLCRRGERARRGVAPPARGGVRLRPAARARLRQHAELHRPDQRAAAAVAAQLQRRHRGRAGADRGRRVPAAACWSGA